jgi:hypothetical protein
MAISVIFYILLKNWRVRFFSNFSRTTETVEVGRLANEKPPQFETDRGFQDRL